MTTEGKMERSVDVHRAYRDATERFDTFVLAALLTSAGYMAQSNPFGRLGVNFQTLFLVSFGFVLIATYFAFKRIEKIIVGLSLNHQALHGHETQNAHLTQLANHALASDIKPASLATYRWRNRFIVLALGTYVAAKIWKAYVGG